MQDIFDIKNLIEIISIMLLMSIACTVFINFKNENINISLSLIIIFLGVAFLSNYNINNIKKEDIENEENHKFYYEIDYNERKNILEKSLKNNISSEEYKCLENEKIEYFQKNCLLKKEEYYKILSKFLKNYNQEEIKNSLKAKIENKINKKVNNLILFITMKIFVLILIITSLISLFNRVFDYFTGSCLNIKQSYLSILYLSSIFGVLLLINEIKMIQILEDISKLNSYISFIFISINIPLFMAIIQISPVHMRIYLLGKENNIIKFNDYYVKDISNNGVTLIEPKIFEKQESQVEQNIKQPEEEKKIQNTQDSKESKEIKISIEEFENGYLMFMDKKESQDIKKYIFPKKYNINLYSNKKINNTFTFIVWMFLFCVSILFFMKNYYIISLVNLLFSAFNF